MKCGCKIITEEFNSAAGHGGMAMCKPWIEFCPLHSCADSFLAFAQQVVKRSHDHILLGMASQLIAKAESK